MTSKHSLRIPPGKLRYYAEQYDFDAETNLEKYGEIAKKQGYIDRRQLCEICIWKSNNDFAFALSNSEEFVKEITKFVFSAKCEESRFGALRLLSGVRFTTASIILHFCVD